MLYIIYYVRLYSSNLNHSDKIRRGHSFLSRKNASILEHFLLLKVLLSSHSTFHKNVYDYFIDTDEDF